MNIPDPYKVLQVDSEAEDEVIEAAYKRLARKYHPDVSPGPDAQDRMVRINQAWEILRDPARRAAVDRARSRGANTSARVAAADARARAAQHAPTPPRAAPAAGASAPHDTRRRETYTRPPQDPARWGFPGVQDPGEGDFEGRTQFVSPNWTSGRSTGGHSYDPASMGMAQGEGSAGPPPGNPQGSVLNFGRYSGWSLGEIARTDLEYLEWLDRAPIGRIYQGEIDTMLRAHGRRRTAPAAAGRPDQRGLFRRR